MKILVCFKAVPDLEMLSVEDWAVDSSLDIDTSFVKNELNCFDESALEMALKLSDYSEGFGAFINLTALTIADNKSELFLKNLYALKFNKAVRIEIDSDIIFNPEIVSAVISQYIKEKDKQDVVILGRQSGVGDNAKTPLLVSEMLGWPCITQVIKIEPTKEEGTLKVKSYVDGGILTQVVKVPVVLSIGNAPNSYLRVPTLKDKMKYGKTPIEVMEVSDFNLNVYSDKITYNAQLVCLEKIKGSRDGVIIEGNTPEEKARILYDLYLKERLEKL